MPTAKRLRILIAASAVSGLIISAAPIGSTSAAPVPAACNERADGGPVVGYGLTADQKLICFKVARPASRTA
jgi:hypothetical protein